MRSVGIIDEHRHASGCYIVTSNCFEVYEHSSAVRRLVKGRSTQQSVAFQGSTVYVHMNRGTHPAQKFLACFPSKSQQESDHFVIEQHVSIRDMRFAVG